MPAVSRKQQRFAACSADPECRKKLAKPMPVKVAKEFRHLSSKARKAAKLKQHMKG